MPQRHLWLPVRALFPLVQVYLVPRDGQQGQKCTCLLEVERGLDAKSSGPPNLLASSCLFLRNAV